MQMTRLPDDPGTTEGACDRCGTKIQRFHGDGDLECPKCGAFYNSFGQRLRDDLRTRPNPSEYDEDIGDLEGMAMMEASEEEPGGEDWI